jgi:hypothetical protein
MTRWQMNLSGLCQKGQSGLSLGRMASLLMLGLLGAVRRGARLLVFHQR